VAARSPERDTTALLMTDHRHMGVEEVKQGP
jgi:hypothetical protein